MLKIAIIGKESYVGMALDRYLGQRGFSVVQIEAKNDQWKFFNFKGIDAVIHVAAIVHRKDISDYAVYQKVNAVLPLEVATTAKAAGVKQFIFFSTMAVFGQQKSLRGTIINKETPCLPKTHYGKSKFEAEQALQKIASNGFKVAIVRPANIYGKNCKGNYMSIFKKIVQKLPVIPKAYTNVFQGFVHIQNLSRCIELLLLHNAGGIYHIQDREKISSTRLMQAISRSLGKEKRLSVFWGIPFQILRISPVVKLFGGVVYADELAHLEWGDYNVIGSDEGIQDTFC